jgi:aspartyl-tRNA(Asn)/glutamyl-tRNA(Gln) amidotransferase subunit C
MTLTITDVEKIAHLARLALTAEQKAQYAQQLTAVLDYAARLDELDLEDVPPTPHAVAQQNIMREDEVEPSLPTGALFYNAPRHQDNQFLIQPVLDNEQS